MTRRARPEEQLHRAVAVYLNMVLPHDSVWFHIPLGGKRSKAEGGIFKAMGVKAGVPDIYILHRGRSYFIELKPKGRYASKVQKDMMDNLGRAGAGVALCRSLDEVTSDLSAWGLVPEGVV